MTIAQLFSLHLTRLPRVVAQQEFPDFAAQRRIDSAIEYRRQDVIHVVMNPSFVVKVILPLVFGERMAALDRRSCDQIRHRRLNQFITDEIEKKKCVKMNVERKKK